MPARLRRSRALEPTPPQELLDSEGRWGVMRAERWGAFLDWLSAKGLLTHKVQTRAGGGEDTATLDGLRAGDVGARIPRESVPAGSLYTNEFLPA